MYWWTLILVGKKTKNSVTQFLLLEIWSIFLQSWISGSLDPSAICHLYLPSFMYCACLFLCCHAESKRCHRGYRQQHLICLLTDPLQKAFSDLWSRRLSGAVTWHCMTVVTSWIAESYFPLHGLTYRVKHGNSREWHMCKQVPSFLSHKLDLIHHYHMTLIISRKSLCFLRLFILKFC
jgi:hypothetical protein